MDAPRRAPDDADVGKTRVADLQQRLLSNWLAVLKLCPIALLWGWNAVPNACLFQRCARDPIFAGHRRHRTRPNLFVELVARDCCRHVLAAA